MKQTQVELAINVKKADGSTKTQKLKFPLTLAAPMTRRMELEAKSPSHIVIATAITLKSTFPPEYLGRTGGYSLCGRRVDLGASNITGYINSPSELWPLPERICYYCRKAVERLPGFSGFENAKNVRYSNEPAGGLPPSALEL